MVVVVAVGCCYGCDGWLSWLVVVVAGGDGVVALFFLSCFCFFYIAMFDFYYFIVLKAKIKPLILGVL